MDLDNLAKTTRTLWPYGTITLENGVWTAIEKKAAESGLSAEGLLSNWLAIPQLGKESLESLIYSKLAKETRPITLNYTPPKNKSTFENALDAVYPLQTTHNHMKRLNNKVRRPKRAGRRLSSSKDA